MNAKHPSRAGIAERVDAKGRKRYRGTAFDGRAKRHLFGPWTPHLAEARAWRVDAMARLQAGTLSAAAGPTIAAAAEQFLAGMEAGTIRNRSGGRYKPSVVTVYRWAFDSHILPALGPTRLGRLNRADVQLWVDQLAGQELAANTIRGTVTPLQALYAWAIPRGLAHVSPCDHLRLPSGEKARDRIATSSEAASLIGALPAKDQAALGLAVYAGLRIGELMAIEWESIDLDARSLRVTRAWDPKAKVYLEAKSKAGQNRVVPIGERLAALLDDHRVLMNHPRSGLLFPGRDPSRPVSPGALRARAEKAWESTGLEPLGFHEGRHTYASLMIAAGINAKALSTYMGHANISITFDRYGHLMPGNESEARGLLDAYLEREGGQP